MIFCDLDLAEFPSLSLSFPPPPKLHDEVNVFSTPAWLASPFDSPSVSFVGIQNMLDD